MKTDRTSCESLTLPVKSLAPFYSLMLIPFMVTCSNLDFAGNSGAKSGGEKKEEISDQPTEVSGGFGLTCMANEMEDVVTDYRVSCHFTALNGSPLAPSDDFDFDIAVTNTQNPITIKKAPQGDKNTFDFDIRKTDLAAAKIETKAVNPKNNNSEIKSITFDIKAVTQLPGQVASITFNPLSGVYTASQDIEIKTATANASIYYTTNGSADPACSNPDAASRYSAPIKVDTAVTIKAVACLDGSTPSPLATVEYTIKTKDPAECGELDNSCYSLQGVSLGDTKKISGTTFQVEFVKADPGCSLGDCLKIWTEVVPDTTDKGAAKILNANGVWDSRRNMGWQTKLSSDGMQQTSTIFKYSEAGQLAGRACPAFTNSYDINGKNPRPTSGICLYYDQGTENQNLNLGRWDIAQSGAGMNAGWYEGKIDTCVNKGMRLPTLYETNSRVPLSNELNNLPKLPVGTNGPEPSNPWISRDLGVPPVSLHWTWTASAYVPGGSSRLGNNNYWVWKKLSETNYDIDYKTSSAANFFAVRCVLPASSIYYP